MNSNNLDKGKYFFIPDWLLKESSQTIHAYVYILNEINSNGGELKTSSIQIANDLKTSRQQARCILDKITAKQPTNNQQITNKTTNKNTLLSIDFIAIYKDLKKQNNQQNNQQTTSKQPAKTFDFKQELINYGFKESLVDDWLKVRKTKKATNTQTAFKSFISEIESRECNINEMLQIAVTYSWSGFKHKWVDNFVNNTQYSKPKEEKIGRTSIETIKKNAEYHGEY